MFRRFKIPLEYINAYNNGKGHFELNLMFNKGESLDPLGYIVLERFNPIAKVRRSQFEVFPNPAHEDIIKVIGIHS
jgi:hypothetical protein